MSESSRPSFGINSWLEDELYQQYLHDGKTVDDSWRKIFESNGAAPKVGGNGSHVPDAPPPPPVSAPSPQPGAGERLVPLRGAQARIAENMAASLSIPTATSQRVIPVQAIDENRRILNEARTAQGKSKLSYTHIIGWAIVKAVEANPALNHAFANVNGESFRAVRDQLNFGIAVDVTGKDGARSLKVPNIKNAGALSFEEYLADFDGIVARARNNKLQLSDFEGTTISLTNPGTVGTFGSVPRLMPGQGAIIATGAIDYPAGFRATPPEVRDNLRLSKVMMVTCTYDHRVIQGAESGMFLARLEELLLGGAGFYEKIFADLGIPFSPARFEPAQPKETASSEASAAAAATIVDAEKQAAVIQMIHAYRVRGHLMAKLDPLGTEREAHPELDPASYGLTMWDMEREFLTGNLSANGHGMRSRATLREILDTLRRTYCGTITCEYMHIQHPDEKAWLQGRMEPEANSWKLGDAVRTRILERVIEAEEFEHFLHTRFIGHKRFSLEGAEAAVAILDEVLDRAANTNVQEAVMGMAHRGRLNVLANIVGKSMVQVFSEFEGNADPFSTQGSGDVKYHLGASGVRKSSEGREITVSVAFNPSHLEAVDPVVEGIVRPKQDRLGDTKRERVLPILIHGDAAFSGQGVVCETLNLSQLEGYTTGGTIHLVINNQIGFTTNPHEARSSPYSTDVARTVQAPIFHVNGDDPEACVRVAQLAYDFRQQFKKDVIIDMVCYRRWGHNEADDPSYTQPVLYRKIKDHPSVAKQYSKKLLDDKVVDAARADQMRKAVSRRLNSVYDESKSNAQKYEVQELSAVDPDSMDRPMADTAISRETVEKVVRGMTAFPADFHVHPKLKGFLEKRREVLNGAPMDWAMGETLAFGSLALEGTPVRLSGQDSGRGTFSQRHLEYSDSEDGRIYIPLRHLSPDQGRFDVFDSSLSEYAVMGFEFGYSVADPLTLVLWEAQFGDFANGAQILIDQFVATAESKWGQPSGIVLLLPHGYEGQGPEHSSARIERFLQLCAENNMQVANATTPSQYFHLLRRQMNGGPDRRGVRKPLIVFTPKRMLRHPKAVSTVPDLLSGRFREVLPDAAVGDPQQVERVLLCSGQVYYDLLAAREERKVEGVALVRLEQLYPFPAAELRDALALYPETADLVWVQEEPRNMGAWRFVREQAEAAPDLSQRKLHYVGRPESASPAPGSLKRHQQEQAGIVEGAFAADLNGAEPKKRSAPKRKK